MVGLSGNSIMVLGFSNDPLCKRRSKKSSAWRGGRRVQGCCVAVGLDEDETFFCDEGYRDR